MKKLSFLSCKCGIINCEVNMGVASQDKLVCLTIFTKDKPKSIVLTKDDIQTILETLK